MDIEAVPPTALFHRNRHVFRILRRYSSGFAAGTFKRLRPAANRPHRVVWMYGICKNDRLIGVKLVQ